MQELVHQNHFVVYPNTFIVFEYLCNQVNIRANRVFVSALPWMANGTYLWFLIMFISNGVLLHRYPMETP